jgi:hypothetical protein
MLTLKKEASLLLESKRIFFIRKKHVKYDKNERKKACKKLL